MPTSIAKSVRIGKIELFRLRTHLFICIQWNTLSGTAGIIADKKREKGNMSKEGRRVSVEEDLAFRSSCFNGERFKNEMRPFLHFHMKSSRIN